MSQRRDDDDAKGQSGDRVHRHVALKKTRGKGRRRVLPGRRIVRGWQRSQAKEDEEDKEAEQDRGEHLAERVDDVAGIPAQVEGDGKENEAEDDRCGERLRPDNGGDRRREGHCPRARQRVEGADREIHHDGEDASEELSRTTDKIADIRAGQGNRNDRDDGESDAADEKTNHCGGQVGTGRRTHNRWEDQVACTEEHGEKRQGGRDEDRHA